MSKSYPVYWTKEASVSYQTSLVYRISGNAIELIAFVDNRSDHNY